MSRPSIAPVPRAVAVFIFALSMLASVSAVSAQGTDATPAAGGDATGGFPAHIHSGTCDTLGDVVFPLNELTRAGADMPMNSTPVAAVSTPAEIASTPAAMTTDATPAMGGGMPVASSTTIVDASLDDILGAEHAINVHESAENIQNYIACGDLTGTATDGKLQIQLKELNGSGFTGEAHLVDNGDGTTTVTVNLMQGGTGTPEASPVS
jgi:hypothetical protein